jgi:hypothetical protein
VQFRVTDSGGTNSVPSTRDIFVTPVNDAPVVTTTEGSTSYIGTPPAVKIDAGLTVGDVDDTNIEGAQVRIASGFTSGDDLVYVDQLGIAGVYNTATGVLTLTGTASVADYQTALRSIRYGRSISGNPSGARTVEFTVNDGDLDSAAATKDLQLNDQPVLTTTGSALSYTENAGLVAVDPEITAADADSATLSGATIQITSNFALGQDHLAFVPQLGIDGFVDPETGILTLFGTASVADYETALRSVTYENSSNDPSGATRTVTVQVDDGGAGSNLSAPVTRGIGVTPVNDAPAVTTSGGTTSYTEGDPATTIDSGLTVADADDTNIESAQVQISSGFESGDELTFTPQNGISGVYNAGVLTLTGTASVADYETALSSIEFSRTATGTQTSKTVEFKVNDGAIDSNAALKSIAITSAQ